jgi:hypothetical protein
LAGKKDYTLGKILPLGGMESQDLNGLYNLRFIDVPYGKLVGFNTGKQFIPRSIPVAGPARSFCMPGIYRERNKMRKHHFRFTLILILSAFVLGACGSSASNATPTSTPLSVEAISTAAVQTAFARLTLEAPTITPTPAFTNTPNVTATPTLKATATKPAPTPAGCANMKFISDVTIPDGTQMPAGQTFTKTWKVQNTGTCNWTTSFKLVFSYGDAMGGQTVSLASTVAPGQNVDISVAMKVPNKTGKLTGVWALEDDKSQPFGPLLTVVINIGTVSPTPTGSLTTTPTLEATAEASSTPTEETTPTLTPTP